jgi:hypothetical protein
MDARSDGRFAALGRGAETLLYNSLYVIYMVIGIIAMKLSTGNATFASRPGLLAIGVNPPTRLAER